MKDTEWHRITCFAGHASHVETHCRKGMSVLVRGRLHYTKWTDSAGVERHGAEVIAESVDFLTRPAKDDAVLIDDDETGA